MRRPIRLPTLDPTLGEILVFLLWLVAILLTMIAMVLIPVFNLLFWPSLWIYDILAGRNPYISFNGLPRELPASLDRTRNLYDREIDG